MSEKQTRQFKPHPNLLRSVIFKQSGSLAKALCELVINSVDAGATEVDVRLNFTGFSVTDNGRGFRDEQEIAECFETFGTPHDEDEANQPRFGSFRMGRGQSFAWAATKWESGRFEMDVDVKNNGLSYDLREREDPVPGCRIHGSLYNALTPFYLEETINDLELLARYIDVPVALNHKRISSDPAKEEWDHIDEDAYIRFTKSNGIAVYNLGMFVKQYSAYSFGINAEVVSRKQLSLCTARNEVLENQCEVWKRIRKVLDSQGISELRDSGKRLTAESRAFVFNKLLSGLTAFQAVAGLKIVKLTNGAHVALPALTQLPLTTAEDGDPRADRMIRTKVARVLSRWTLEQCHARTVEEFLDRIGETGCWNNYGRPKVVDFDELARQFTNEYAPVAYQELSVHEKVVLGAITKAYQEFCDRISLRRQQDHSVTGLQASRWGRTISFGDSDTAHGWTDGRANIWLNRKYVTKLLATGPHGAQAVAALVIHELCHDDDDIGSHQHDPDFMETFHDTMCFDGDLVGRMVNTMVSAFLSKLIRQKMKIPASYKGHFAFKYNELTEPADRETGTPDVEGESG